MPVKVLTTKFEQKYLPKDLTVALPLFPSVRFRVVSTELLIQQNSFCTESQVTLPADLQHQNAQGSTK